MATRDVFCYTLLGYRVWNVAFKTTSNTWRRRRRLAAPATAS